MTARERSGVADARELVITRTFDAPRELVWSAWTERERAMRWAGPKDFTAPELEGDVRPGGAWRTVLRSPDGEDHPQHGVYLEVVPPERLVFTFAWDSAPENEMLVTVTFTERAGKTEMVFRQTGFPSVESRNGHEGGWTQAFDRLAEHLAGRR
ncbi:MAG TPA: SRPBCC domain-containing protein [Gemmatimonadaceae bacterium]|nr:SRPBCC domain-containing protein [Gemmatimonadaceae bacterium]